MVSARWLPNRPAWWYPSWSRVTSLLTPVCFFVTLMDGQYWRSTVGSFCCYKSEEYWMRLHQHPTTILRNIVFKAPYFCCCSLLEHFRYSLFFVTPTIGQYMVFYFYFLDPNTVSHLIQFLHLWTILLYIILNALNISAIVWCTFWATLYLMTPMVAHYWLVVLCILRESSTTLTL